MFGHCAAGRARDYGRAYGRHWHPGKFGNFASFGPRRPKHNIPVNIEETDTSYEIYLYALGFDKENVTVSVVRDVLYVSGKRTVEEGFNPNFIHQEYPVKAFEKSFVLNDSVDVENISAKQVNGVLIITCPKLPEAQRREYDVMVA
ncbi:MAG: Hsp20/alpha crystallin family protein [Lewinellaceae bacterium]|nr:Hsp20/alpha crystallin family protein [Lewinella sp.]MCB9277447.1 Hsp20/alpha crystallin family protein [Lewinellaceae bacterium]